MYYIEPSALIGKQFTIAINPKAVYRCIGYGQPPDVGTLLIVGMETEANGNSTVRTFNVKDVTFMP